jgi:hypothetical protein
MAQFVVTYFGFTAPQHTMEALRNRISQAVGRTQIAKTNGGSYIVGAPDVAEQDKIQVMSKLRDVLPEWNVFLNSQYITAFDDDV